MLSKLIIVTGTSLAAISATSGAEAELTPLSDYLELPKNEFVLTYPMTRCAGLYFGVLDYAGRNFSAAVQADTKQDAALLVTAVVAIRVASSEGQPAELTKFTVEIVDQIAHKYVQRFKTNYALSGQAWSGDDLVKGDMTVCKAAILPMAKEFHDALPDR